MDDLSLLVDLHRSQARLGPGSDAATRRALDLSGLRGRPDLHVADLGCGTGASTLTLARELGARITAVDLFPEFLSELERRATEADVAEQITPVAASFDDLPFAPASLDAIWSEGAIYNLGFAAGVAAWTALLKPGGVLAVSELTWLTADRPPELQSHWDAAYPEVATASRKLAVLEQAGLRVLGYFPLDESCWLEGYYRPLQARFPAFLEAHPESEAARALVSAEADEIALYERHRAHVSYGFYVAQKV